MDGKCGTADAGVIMDVSFFRGLRVSEEGEAGFGGEAAGSPGIFGRRV